MGVFFLPSRAGKVIVLKEEDTDVESNRRPRSFRKYPRKTRKGPRSSGREAADANGTGSVINIFFLSYRNSENFAYVYQISEQRT